MNQNEAKEGILYEFRCWLKANPRENPDGRDARQFYYYLCDHRPHLLQFRCSGDNWQHVHGWLLHARLVSD